MCIALAPGKRYMRPLKRTQRIDPLWPHRWNSDWAGRERTKGGAVGVRVCAHGIAEADVMAVCRGTEPC